MDVLLKKNVVVIEIIFFKDLHTTFFSCNEGDDLVKSNEKNGVLDFMRIIQTMQSFDVVEFGIEDIVRSGLVREYLISKINLGM